MTSFAVYVQIAGFLPVCELCFLIFLVFRTNGICLLDCCSHRQFPLDLVRDGLALGLYHAYSFPLGPSNTGPYV
ncbi:hypothetical protein BDV38DRAFT_212374 [Aspergillus pseudotamarii]|uniref:Uncharacterized protein n=1 Tax=Aspergillus pseudotamarii TaxID=132259 RepID=A0A5N6SF84_ASPPS|nr:uncharacterized protein BDV38DRAFT_212374 [Aspergillus pseudotamarii]KAE8132341.1 hypothetical protein BDV38DRAFT_212374 [Aspergillus pseudotamarii]